MGPRWWSPQLRALTQTHIWPNLGLTRLGRGSLLVLLYYRAQGREQWIHNAGAAPGESEEGYGKVVGGPT